MLQTDQPSSGGDLDLWEPGDYQMGGRNSSLQTLIEEQGHEVGQAHVSLCLLKNINFLFQCTKC